MKAVELSKSYNPKDFEQRIYDQWLENKAFSPDKDGKEHFTVVMPPPNVTGILHMGHALNNTLQDIIIRYKRMKECCRAPACQGRQAPSGPGKGEVH